MKTKAYISCALTQASQGGAPQRPQRGKAGARKNMSMLLLFLLFLISLLIILIWYYHDYQVEGCGTAVEMENCGSVSRRCGKGQRSPWARACIRHETPTQLLLRCNLKTRSLQRQDFLGFGFRVYCQDFPGCWEDVGLSREAPCLQILEGMSCKGLDSALGSGLYIEVCATTVPIMKGCMPKWPTTGLKTKSRAAGARQAT